MGNIPYQSEYEICQICRKNLDVSEKSKIDGPSLRKGNTFEELCDSCPHFFHCKCIENEFVDYIFNNFPFKLHCEICGFLKNYTHTCFWELTLYKMILNSNIDTEYDDWESEFD